MKFSFQFNCWIFFLIYSGILMTGLTSQTNRFHRLKNTSYYVLIPDYDSDYIEGRNRFVENYLTSKNNPPDNALPQTTVNSSKLGANIKRPWLSYDSRIIRNNALAEEQVDINIKGRSPELTIGELKVSSSKKTLSYQGCGIYSNKYIVGGTQAPEGSHPWIVALFVSGGMWCSATIINEWWVVTAAHAFEAIGTGPERVTISVGNNDRTKGTIYKISKIITHTRYNAYKYKSSDIALMKVDGPIVMGPNVRPICLPDVSYQKIRTKSLIVAGWGFVSYGVPVSPIQLRQVQLNILPLEKCAQIYSKIRYKIFRSQICTYNKGQDACQGDSGGPAIEIVNGKGTLVGIVSYGVTCADDYPGVFTTVSYFLGWIQNAIRNN